jgi:hypothetical protein
LTVAADRAYFQELPCIYYAGHDPGELAPVELIRSDRPAGQRRVC